MARGNISVDSENLFPIIKKWLYSDKDIFLRELVSNSCDAITKLKKLSGIGEAQIEDEPLFRIDVTVDKKNKKLIISDNGIGMTAEEIDKYINQIAFSGASDFLTKYKDENDKGSQIIGHFGLGFYSAFMVSDSVEIDSLSYTDGAKSAKWVCDGTMEYEMSEGERNKRGTTITLNISKDSKEFLEEGTIRQILGKYCSFLPVEIYLNIANKPSENPQEDAPEEKPINNTNPLWIKKPAECKEEEYKEFYTNLFLDFNEPLFWIHLNIDFPFRLKGILYFPKINHEFSAQEGQIKLFNNQVFVADNVKEVIPEFLMLLKGVIDCPDLPLNVSRSFLQNDGYVKKISAHITKKIADKLTSLYKKEKDNYIKYWEDINIFIKYGCLRDEKFFEKIESVMIYKDTEGNYLTLDEYLEGKESKNVYYTNDPEQQAQYIAMFREQGINALVLPSLMDTHFISFMEMKKPEIKFKRIDSDLSQNYENKTDNEENKTLIEKVKAKINDENIKIEIQELTNSDLPAILLLSEQSRRIQEMYRSYGQQIPGMANMFHDEFTLVLNSSNELVKKIDSLDNNDSDIIIEHIYDLAKISHAPLTGEQMTKFIQRSNIILDKLYNK